MFGFIKNVFVVAMTFIDFILSNVNSLECVSMNNQECKRRPEIINFNTNEPLFYPNSIKISKCNGSCNKSMIHILKYVFLRKLKTQMSSTNETRHKKWHKTCKCRCRLDASICNNKQRWNEDKCRCECKELIDKRMCDKGFIWNPSNCEYEGDKSCNIGEYLD